MSSRLRFSTVSSAPSGSSDGVLFERYSPSIPSASYLLSHVLNAASLTLLARQNSDILTSGLLRYSLMRTSFSRGFSLLYPMARSTSAGVDAAIVFAAAAHLSLAWKSGLPCP